MDSILTSIKKLLGLEEDQTHFDQDVLMHINSVLMIANQLGIGPNEGFSVTGYTETWIELLGERKDLEAVKTYIYLKVRLLFDPPTSGFVTDSIERTITQFEWRLNVQAEGGPTYE